MAGIPAPPLTPPIAATLMITDGTTTDGSTDTMTQEQQSDEGEYVVSDTNSEEDGTVNHGNSDDDDILPNITK